MPDGAVFYIPAVGDGEIPGIVPLFKGRFAGIRITPRMRTDSVQIDVSALTATNKKLSESTCDEVRSWNSEDAGSYEGKENATFFLSGVGSSWSSRFQSESCPRRLGAAGRLSSPVC
jgi:hypothetical protein